MDNPSNLEKKRKSINYYIFLSILIHASMFMLTDVKKDITLGEKIIPIEIIDIPSISSKGEYFEKLQKKGVKDIRELFNQEKEINKEVQEEIIEENEDLNINKVNKIIKENIINPRDSGINKDIGSEGKLNSNELEKGSVKGKGEEKITCLSCLKPKYPKIALKRGYEGILKLKIFISKNGEVTDIKVIKSSGYTILDNSGIDAAKKSRFYPLKKERTLNIEYNLNLNRW